MKTLAIKPTLYKNKAFLGLSPLARHLYTTIAFQVSQDKTFDKDRVLFLSGMFPEEIRPSFIELKNSGLVAKKGKSWGLPNFGKHFSVSDEKEFERAYIQIFRRVFDHWKEVMERPRARPTDEKRAKVYDRLSEGYTEQDILDAIDGCSYSDFHMGENDQGKRYNCITLICRNGENLERFLGYKEEVEEIEKNKPTGSHNEVENWAEKLEAARNRKNRGDFE